MDQIYYPKPFSRAMGLITAGAVLIALSGFGVAAGTATLSLNDLTQQALHTSPKLAAAKLDFEAAKKSADAAAGAQRPRLGLEATDRYQTQVPSFSPVPGGAKVAFGDNNNYNAGAVLSGTLWDFGALGSRAGSAAAGAESKQAVYEATRRQIILAVRMAYFQARIAREQMRLLEDSQNVAQSQYADIDKQLRAGTASRLELLASHQDVLDYSRQYRAAQTAFTNALEDLYAVVGVSAPADLNNAADVQLDSQDESLKLLSAETVAAPDDSMPQLKTYAYLARSAQLASEAVTSDRLPRLTFAARSDFEYPNGPTLETIQQNTVSATLSLPLFDWGLLVNDSEARQKQAQMYLSNLNQARIDMKRDWTKAQSLLQSYKDQREFNEKAAVETTELARLTYESFRLGHARFLEVQSSNVRVLGAKVQQAGTDVQILMQMAILASLSGKGATP